MLFVCYANGFPKRVMPLCLSKYLNRVSLFYKSELVLLSVLGNFWQNFATKQIGKCLLLIYFALILNTSHNKL